MSKNQDVWQNFQIEMQDSCCSSLTPPSPIRGMISIFCTNAWILKKKTQKWRKSKKIIFEWISETSINNNATWFFTFFTSNNKLQEKLIFIEYWTKNAGNLNQIYDFSAPVCQIPIIQQFILHIDIKNFRQEVKLTTYFIFNNFQKIKHFFHTYLLIIWPSIASTILTNFINFFLRWGGGGGGGGTWAICIYALNRGFFFTEWCKIHVFEVD